MGNNSVPKFIFRLSRFPVYRGSVLGRFYCIIKYSIVSANTFKKFWLLVSTALQPSSGQPVQIKCLHCAYNMGSIDIRFNSGYVTHITVVHTMGSHIVRTLKALDLYRMA